MASQTTDHDVIVVGAGPVGLLTARLLGLAGHDVHGLERWPEPYPLPRAMHVDHEIRRLPQSAAGEPATAFHATHRRLSAVATDRRNRP